MKNLSVIVDGNVAKFTKIKGWTSDQLYEKADICKATYRRHVVANAIDMTDIGKLSKALCVKPERLLEE